MRIDGRTETLLYALREKLQSLPRINLCQDNPPANTHYCHVQVIDGQRGITFVKPNNERISISEQTYRLFHGYIMASATQEGTLYFTRPEELSPDLAAWTAEEALALGDLTQFLDGYNVPQQQNI